MKYWLALDSAFSEVIIAPLHDPEHAPWLGVHIESDLGQEIARESLWDCTSFFWNDAKRAARFRLKIFGSFSRTTHDCVVVCLTAPKAARIKVALLDKAGAIIGKWSPGVIGRGVRQEIICRIPDLLPLTHRFRSLFESAQFAGVVVQIDSDPSEVPVVSMNWVGLRNSRVHDSIRRLQSTYVPDWSPWILPDDAQGPIRFERGLLFDFEALAGVRAKLRDPHWQAHFSVLEKRAAAYMRRVPEADFGDYLPNHDTRYLRASQHGRTCYHWEALVVAFVGLVREDRAMIRHACRYLMCMVHTRFWTESGEHNVPSSTWTHLSFQEEMTTTSVAILLDWLGFALFPRTRNLARKALFEKGMSHVARDLSTRESLGAMNQGAVFRRALILGGLMLEPAWPCLDTAAVDRAFEAQCDVLRRYVKADGGVHEGIGYLCQTMTATLWSIIAYCRARGRDWRSEVGGLFGNVGRYVAAMSAMQAGKAIAAGDCRVEWFGGDALPIMAELIPDSAFAGILGNCLKDGWVHELTGTLSKSGGLVGMVYGPDVVNPSRRVVPEFDFLPDSGKVAMVLGGAGRLPVHLWVSGSARGNAHVHRDLGQFVLEAGEVPIFVDRGMVQYWNAEAHFLSRSWLHNVLTPVRGPGDYPNQDVPSSFDALEVSRDPTRIVVPGCDVWAGWMSDYQRRFAVLSPSSIQVQDEFALVNQGSVAFHLHSHFAFEVAGTRARLQTPDCVVELSFPWAKLLQCQPVLHDVTQRPVFHICATSDVLSGRTVLDSGITIEHA